MVAPRYPATSSRKQPREASCAGTTVAWMLPDLDGVYLVIAATADHAVNAEVAKAAAARRVLSMPSTIHQQPRRMRQRRSFAVV